MKTHRLGGYISKPVIFTMWSKCLWSTTALCLIQKRVPLLCLYATCMLWKRRSTDKPSTCCIFNQWNLGLKETCGLTLSSSYITVTEETYSFKMSELEKLRLLIVNIIKGFTLNVLLLLLLLLLLLWTYTLFVLIFAIFMICKKLRN